MRNSVKLARTEARLTQAELAKRLGVSRQTVNAIETKQYVPSAALALKLARLFSTSVEGLFQLETGD
jgi:putative transcriptional regulator